MRLRCMGSGSNGNCYALIANSGETLLLDLGISENEIKIGCDFNLKSIVGACVTHSHL